MITIPIWAFVIICILALPVALFICACALFLVLCLISMFICLFIKDEEIV